MDKQLKTKERVILFIRRQISDISQDGLPAMLRKLYIILLIPLAVPVVFLVRALRPLITIRFGELISARIGHLASNTELYVCEREAGMHDNRRIIDIFYYGRIISNHQLAKMWNRVLPVFLFAVALDKVNRFLPGGEPHLVPWRYRQDRDIYGLYDAMRPRLSFTSEEERLGEAALGMMGISKGDSFVCVHSRDSAYLDKAFPGANWNYHNYRDSDIKDFIPAATELTRRGYFAVRTGAAIKEPLKNVNPRIIDYAAKNRTDFLDIFLGAKCRFYLGDGCGFTSVSKIFRRPLALTNLLPLENLPAWSSSYLLIPKKLWIRKERRFMTFREVLDLEAGRVLGSEDYDRFGVDVIKNTPEEIISLAMEMDERLNGTWRACEGDEELQRRFWALFKPNRLNQVFASRIGAEFLRQNRELLEEEPLKLEKIIKS